MVMQTPDRNSELVEDHLRPIVSSMTMESKSAGSSSAAEMVNVA